MSKLINLVNAKALVDFMSELFCQLQDIYPNYVGRSSSQKGEPEMSFEQFACFASDYDIFPRFCSKPALYRVFHTLALMKEVL